MGSLMNDGVSEAYQKVMIKWKSGPVWKYKTDICRWSISIKDNSLVVEMLQA